MVETTNLRFGYLPPPAEKVTFAEGIYSFSKKMASWGLEVPRNIIEKAYPYPIELIPYYDQGELGACVGYSCSWFTTIANLLETGEVNLYDAIWLYHQAQLNDNDPKTDPSIDSGTYLWSAMDILRKKGHRKVVNNVIYPENIREGIKSYYWVKSIGGLRTTFILDRPVVLGVRWYKEFMKPDLINGEYWIGEKGWKRKNFLGGHAIIGPEISDNRQALRLLGTWGDGYPPVWISYNSIIKLLREGGEIVVGIDRKLDLELQAGPK